MASLGGTNLGDVQSESQSKDANLFQMPIPTQDSSSAFLLDIFGMSRTITLEGIFRGTLAEQDTFIDAIETIAAGNQTGSTFVSSHTATANKTVYVQNFNWTVDSANTNYVTYSLTMIEGASS